MRKTRTFVFIALCVLCLVLLLPSVLAASLSDGKVGIGYLETLMSHPNGERIEEAYLDKGSLPPGMFIDYGQDQAYIAGTPTQAGSYEFTLAIVDENHNTYRESFSITILTPALTAEPTLSPSGTLTPDPKWDDPSPSPSPSASPSLTPKVTATPKATQKVTPTPKATAKVTATPTPTPEPSKQPYSIGSVKLDSASSASPTPSPTPAAHVHDFSGTYQADEKEHWHVCSCGEIADRAAHEFKWATDEDGIRRGTCSVCGAVVRAASNSGNPLVRLIAGIAGGLVLLAAIIVVCVLGIKKKKNK